MLFENFYYFNIIEKITGNILNLFNNIKIKKYVYNKTTNNWTETEQVVNIEIATKSKVLREYEYLNIGYGNTFTKYPNLPRISLMINDLSKFDEQQTNQLNKFKISYSTDNTKINYLNNPSWWKLNFTLNIICRRIEDFSQIIEQILPIFQPQYSINVKLIPELDFNIKLPVSINPSLNFEINDEINKDQIRLITTELMLSVPIPLFPPIYDSNIIKSIKTNFGLFTTTSNTNYYTIEDSFNYYALKINTNIKLSSNITITSST